MSDIVDAPAASPGEAAASPSEPTQEQPTSTPEYSTEDVSKWRSDSENYKKVQEYFNANRDLVDFAYKYSEDPKAQELVQRYKSGNVDFSEPAKETSMDDLELENKDQISKVVEKLVQERLGPVSEELKYLRTQHANSQITSMSQKYTVDNGYPVNFNDVKEDIANLITAGKAVDAESAYKLVMADRWPGLKKQYEDKILEEKRKASMSKYSVPSSLNLRQKQERAKNFAEALEQAEQSSGATLGDKLSF